MSNYYAATSTPTPLPALTMPAVGWAKADSGLFSLHCACTRSGNSSALAKLEKLKPRLSNQQFVSPIVAIVLPEFEEGVAILLICDSDSF